MVFLNYYFIYLINSRQSFYVHKANPCCLRYRRWKRWEWRRYKILFEYVSNLDLIIFLFLFCLQCSFEKLVTEKKSMRWGRIRSQKYGLVPICPKKNARPYVCCTVSLVFSLWDRLKNIRSNNTYRLSYAYWIPLKSLFWGNKLSMFC